MFYGIFKKWKELAILWNLILDLIFSDDVSRFKIFNSRLFFSHLYFPFTREFPQFLCSRVYWCFLPRPAPTPKIGEQSKWDELRSLDVVKIFQSWNNLPTPVKTLQFRYPSIFFPLERLGSCFIEPYPSPVKFWKWFFNVLQVLCLYHIAGFFAFHPKK